MKKILFILCWSLLVLDIFAEEKQLLLFDFSSATTTAKKWLKKNDFKDYKGFGRFPFDAKLQNKRLYIINKKKNFGFYGKEVEIQGAKKLRVTWGIDKFFTKAGDKLKIAQNIHVYVTLSFGDEKLDSGSALIPNVPYFISFVLSKSSDNTTFQKGKYYQKGGRYYCPSCPAKQKEVVVSEVDLLFAVKQAFNLQRVPKITAVSFGVDNRKTSWDAVSFIEKIEILD